MLGQNILYATAALVALTNPITELPIFLNVVQGGSAKETRRSALIVAVGVWAILMLSALVGLHALALFGIELPAFRTAGGLLLLLMGLEMSLGRQPVLQDVKHLPGDADEALWVPLIMPMLAGPGAIVTTVTLTIREELLMGWLPVATTAAVTISALVIFLVLSIAGIVASYLPDRARRILTRFAGLILTAIGIQMGFYGIADFFG